MEGCDTRWPLFECQQIIEAGTLKRPEDGRGWWGGGVGPPPI